MRRADAAPRRDLVGRLRKAFADHVWRRSESVMVELHTAAARTAASGARPGWLEVRVVERAADLPPLDPWLAHRAAAFRRMADAGKVGVFVLAHGVGVGCVWIAFADHRDRASREFYRVGPGEAYHYCWLVAPAWRPRGVALPLAREAMRYLRGRGVRRQFGVVDRVNRASYLVQKHLGYRECGVRVRHYVLFHFRWTRTSTYRGVLGLAG